MGGREGGRGRDGEREGGRTLILIVRAEGGASGGPLNWFHLTRLNHFNQLSLFLVPSCIQEDS